MFKKALISTSDKSGLGPFARILHSTGCKIISTGGTAEFLRKEGIPVTQISEETGFPEVMDGRVRTLHPRVHMALLARGDVPEDLQLLKEHKLEPYDLIVVNLYPFEEAAKRNAEESDLIENIDIGGPSMLRSAAKNFDRIAVVTDPGDYSWLTKRIEAHQELSREERRELAIKVFKTTAKYDDMIAKTFSGTPMVNPFASVEPVAQLRYGENPHQTANWLRNSSFGLHQAEILHGKALSYNNILDLDAAVSTVREFDRPAAVAVKHTNPCGVGSGESLSRAVHLALTADPVSVFGGIIAVNGAVDLTAAAELSKIFLECVIATDFSPEALETLKRKKDIRLLKWPQMMESKSGAQEFRSVLGGVLVQDLDRVKVDNTDFKYIGQKPTPEILNDLMFAWRVCAHLKSNAIAISAAGQTLGLGMGQVNRVDAVEHAIERMQKHHPGARHAVLASDAFFPFPDSIEKIAAAGINWVIQPGGSIRDQEVFAKAESLRVNIIVTGVRHFKH